MPVFAHLLGVHDSALSQITALSRCWYVGDQKGRSNETGQANRSPSGAATERVGNGLVGSFVQNQREAGIPQG